MVRAISDEEVAAAAKEVELKIRDVSPPSSLNTSRQPLAHIYFQSDTKTLKFLPDLRRAFNKKYFVSIEYCDNTGTLSQRPVRPLGIEYWGKFWTLTAWCELRADFRVFRLDRITKCEVTDKKFKPEKGKNYEDYLKKLKIK